jgi:beta-glucosidase
MEELDRSAARLLALVNRATASLQPGYQSDFPAHHQLAQRIARESIVLLKNEDDILPIAPDRPQKLLVVGTMAVAPVIQGSGCATTTPWILDRPLDEIVEIAGNSLLISYVAGTAADGARDEQSLKEAVSRAAQSDTVVLFVNDPVGQDGENGDRQNLCILPAHEELIDAIAAVQRNLVNPEEMNFADVGTGVMDWPLYWQAAVEAGAELMIAEHDAPSDWRRFARVSAKAMRRLGSFACAEP